MAAEALTRRVDACPDAETLAAFLDGRLTAGEHADVMAHVADCDACGFVVAEIAQTAAAAPVDVEHDVKPAPPWWKSKRVIWSSSTAAGLATAAMVWLAVSGGWHRSPSDSASLQARALQALAEALTKERTVDVRLTGGFAYGPRRAAVRSGPLSGVSVSPDVRIAAAQMEKAAGGDTSADGLRARGIAALVIGDVNRSVSAFEEAAAKRPSDARIQSDLSAAYLARADLNPQSDDLSNALAAANRAVNLDRTLPEALFNRASALERLSLMQDARQAWLAYLTVDDGSGWAGEARQHLRNLQ